MLNRLEKSAIESSLKSFPAVAILGARQVGKTTLARQLIATYPNALMLDLERPSDLNKLTDAEEYLRTKKMQLVCIDEVQLRPDLFPLLRSLIDEDRRPGRFLILGSSAPELLRQSSESLAGRIALHFVTPLNAIELQDVPTQTWQDRLWRGGFPGSILANSDEISWQWRESYIQTFLNRDLRQFGVEQSPATVQRLWTMCAHSQGQLLNYSKIGQSLDQTHPTVSAHIDILESTFMVRRLLPYIINTKKRLVKSPKIFVRDSGLLCALLGLGSFDTLFGHPSYVACWEGFALENILSIVRPKGMFGFFRSHTGEEIDLVIEHHGKRVGIEFKTSSAPKLTDKNLKAMEFLSLDRLFLVTPSSERYPIGQRIEVMGLEAFIREHSR